MRRFSTFLLAFVLISGCGQGLRTLIRVNSEQESQHKDIAEQGRKFKLLLEHIESGSLKLGFNSQKIIDSYGEPILEKEISGKKRFLYRDPIEFNPDRKVYLYFDQEDKLIASELVVKDPQEVPTE